MGQTLTNDHWSIERVDVDTVRLTGPDGASTEFDIVFRVFLATRDPKPAKTQVTGVNYKGATSWISSLPDAESGIGSGDNRDQGDGFDPSVVTKPGKRTANLFAAAASKEIRPLADTVETDGIVYQFGKDSAFAFSARLGFDAVTKAPLLTTALTAATDAYYSVAYTGAPACAAVDAGQTWQPLIWQERRFPATSYLTAAYHCPVPSALVTRGEQTVGVVAHPSEFPFIPLPVFENSRFGVAVRNQAGQAQPILAAPILGGAGSKLKEGASTSFRFCPVVVRGDTTVAFERIARDIYNFRDVRHNQIGSLNQAFENMVAYGMSAYSHFQESQKGCSYATDAPGTVKNVSSLSPLDIALTTDSREIWQRRAYPYVEYMLSREKFLFTTDESTKVQSPSYTLNGPVAPVSELVALYRISNQATGGLLKLAETEFNSSRTRNLNVKVPGSSWQNALHLYRATGEDAYLESAIKGADKYIARRITDLPEKFDDPDAAFNFWVGYAPRFVDLMWLYETIKEERPSRGRGSEENMTVGHPGLIARNGSPRESNAVAERILDAAWKAARFYAMHCWMAPRIPETDVTVNKGGKAPVYWYLAKRTKGPIKIPEETIPAWRVSAQGLTCESSATSTGHRAIFMANFAPYFLRLAWLKNDDFLRDVARSAIVGRWMNFPGYHMNTGRTTVYEKPNYPLRPFKELSYNSFHFNHIWPLMSVVLDYLVTDAVTRSDGAISFDREFIEGYAYLQSSYYGMRPGQFYGEAPVFLWMPRGLVDVSSAELNYIVARGKKSLCLAFCSQAFESETATVTLDTTLVPALAGATRSARVWVNNKPAAPIAVVDGRFSIQAPAKGIVSLVIDGVAVVPSFQEGFADLGENDVWREAYVEFADPAGRALVLNFGSAYRSLYVYLKDSKRDYTSVRLSYTIGDRPSGDISFSRSEDTATSDMNRTSNAVTGERKGKQVDDAFPWEFTVPLKAEDRSLHVHVEGIRPDGTIDTIMDSKLPSTDE